LVEANYEFVKTSLGLQETVTIKGIAKTPFVEEDIDVKLIFMHSIFCKVSLDGVEKLLGG
jgi:hypothetical protein